MSLSDRRRERVHEVLGGRLASLVVVVEAVRRRHNTSAILRSAEAFGVHEVHLITGDFRPARGAARGAERWLELHSHATTTEAIEALKARGFAIWVADLAPEAIDPMAVPVDRPIAVLFGSELDGVSDEARALSACVLAAPMRGLPESLNVSAAAAVVIYALAERRRGVVGGSDLEPERREAFYQDWLVTEAEAEVGMQVAVGADAVEDPGWFEAEDQ